MQTSGADEGPLKRFMKTPWFRILYIVLLSLASALILYGTGCLSLLVVPLMLFAVPYWLKERRIRNFLMNGIVAFFLTSLAVNVILTQDVVGSQAPDLSAESGTVSLSSGTVTPYRGGAGSYVFSVTYTNTTTVDPSNVVLTLGLTEFVTQNRREYAMTGDTIPPVSQGWRYSKELNLSEDVYYFNFTATTRWTNGASIVSTPQSWGPLNAPWTTYFFVWTLIVFFNVALALFMYGIIIGLYWWSQRMKQIRGPMFPPTRSEAGGEFECTNCGADVSEEATRCPKCGAVFDDEPVVRAQKVEKEKNSEPEADHKDKEGKKKG